MKKTLRLIRFFFVLSLIGVLFGAAAVAGAYYYVRPELPSTESLKDVRLQVPLRIFSRDGKLIAEYGEMKRIPLRYKDTPPRLIQAFLAAEDDRFYEHPGVDYQGLIRATLHLIRTGEKGQGGSTITMQVARNFFLSREKTYLRKLEEIFLALRIDHELSKEDILELYLNKIYLGHRAYGVGAAAEVYYGKDIHNLNLAQMAMIAGLPKAPSRYNPLVDPKRALERRNYVLGRMRSLGFINDQEYREAMAAPVTAESHNVMVELEAPYIAEMARAEMVSRYGNEAYTAGFKVYTTVDSSLQAAANRALRDGLLAYDRRHGYRGPEGHTDIPADGGSPEQWQQSLADYGVIGGLQPALVTAVEQRKAQLFTADGQSIELGWDGMSWARSYHSETSMGPAPQAATDILHPGDIVRVHKDGQGHWQLAEIPQVSGALISLRPEDGAVQALIGGFDFFHSKFNRVTQAQRQPGSNFKPFIYSAALEHGFTPATVVNDAPVVFDDKELEGAWRPENYSGRFFGPTRLRVGLVHSRNLVSIRVLRQIGLSAALDHVRRFGFDTSRLPHNLSLALGSGAVSPWELVRGYTVFANGGFLVEPYFIDRITDSDDKVMFQADPLHAAEPDAPGPAADAPAPMPVKANGDPPTLAGNPPVAVTDLATTPSQEKVPKPRPAPRVISPQNDYLMTSMMRDVIRHGTGRGALVLGRHDLAGKTGTTNDQQDAWFSGFNRSLVTTAWVGFDTPRSLGRAETGARAALPIWIEYMRSALDGVPEEPLPQPPDIVTARIDPETGQFTTADNPKAIFEVFRAENVPDQSGGGGTQKASSGQGGGGSLTEQIF